MNVSVIIPTYNRERTIKRSLESVITQTMYPYEIIVVDDGSTDGTVEIVEQIDGVKLLKQNHRGAQAARNLGVLNARGDYIAFLDSDDEWVPQMLEQAVEALSKHEGRCVTYSDCYIDNGRNKRIWRLPECGNNSYNNLLLHAGPMFQSMVIKRELFIRVGLLDENVVAFQEWDAAIQFAKEVEFIHIKTPLFKYYVCNDDSISKNLDKAVEGYEYILRKHAKEIKRVHGFWGLEKHYKELTKMAFKAQNRRFFIFMYYLVYIKILIAIKNMRVKRI